MARWLFQAMAPGVQILDLWLWVGVRCLEKAKVNFGCIGWCFVIILMAILMPPCLPLRQLTSPRLKKQQVIHLGLQNCGCGKMFTCNFPFFQCSAVLLFNY